MMKITVWDDGRIAVDNDDPDDDRCAEDDLVFRAILVALGIADPSLLDNDEDDHRVKVADRVRHGE